MSPKDRKAYKTEWARQSHARIKQSEPERWRALRDGENEAERTRRATDPIYRERCREYERMKNQRKKLRVQETDPCPSTSQPPTTATSESSPS